MMNIGISIIIATSILSFVLWEALVMNPYRELNIRKNFLDDYENCKRISKIEYNLGWLRNCDNQAALPKECKEILENGYPWDLDSAYFLHINNQASDITKDAYEKYPAFLEKFNNCPCQALPKPEADELIKKEEKDKAKCLVEFEVMLKSVP